MKKLDIPQIIAAKSPKLAQRIPRFVYRWLDKLLHTEEINDIFDKGKDMSAHEFLRAFFDRQEITYDVQGLEELDPKGRYLFASNHPFGGMDGMLLADMMLLYFGDVRVVVNDILMNVKPLAPLWIPVNTLGRQTLKSAQMFDEALEGDLPILTFPAGLCSRVFDGEVCDPEWKNTTVKRAHTSARDVVPVFVDGTLHKGFYRLYKLRKLLGIKANIEMLLLVDGMFRQKGRTIKVRFGKPISTADLTSFGSIAEQTLAVRKASYALRNKL